MLVLRAVADLVLDERRRDARAELGRGEIADVQALRSSPRSACPAGRGRSRTPTRTLSDRRSVAAARRLRLHAASGDTARRAFTPAMCHRCVLLSTHGTGDSPARLIVAACGGTQIPTHNGYKGADKAKPWKKSKTLEVRRQARGQGRGRPVLSRAAARRVVRRRPAAERRARSAARDHAAGDAVNDEFDLAMEVLDPATA